MYHSVNSQRYGKARGMKVKHLLQLVALTVLFTWFLYQLNISHKAKVLSLRAAEKEEDVDDELLINSDNNKNNNNWSGGLGGVGGRGGGGGVGGVVSHDETVSDEAASEVARDEFIDKKSVVKSRKELRPRDTTELDQMTAERDSDDDGLFGESGAGAGVGMGLGEGDDRIANSVESGVKLSKKSQIEIKAGGKDDDDDDAVVEDNDSRFRERMIEVAKDGPVGDRKDDNRGEDSNSDSSEEVDAPPIELTTTPTTAVEKSTALENVSEDDDRTEEDTTATTAADSSLIGTKLEHNSPPLYPSEGVPDDEDVPDNLAEPVVTSSNLTKEEQSGDNDVGRNLSEQISDAIAKTADKHVPPPANGLKTELVTTMRDDNTSEDAEIVSQVKRSDQASGPLLSQDNSEEETEAVKNLGDDDSQQVITDTPSDVLQEYTSAANGSSKLEAGVERGLVEEEKEEEEGVLDKGGVIISGNTSSSRNPYRSSSSWAEEVAEIGSPIPSMQNGAEFSERGAVGRTRTTTNLASSESEDGRD